MDRDSASASNSARARAAAMLRRTPRLNAAVRAFRTPPEASRSPAPAPGLVAKRPALAGLTGLLPEGPGLAVVIMAGAADDATMQRWLRRFPYVVHLIGPECPDPPGERVTHHVAETMAERNRSLERIGPVDILVDLVPATVAQHREAWRTWFLEVKRDGVYVLPIDMCEGERPHDGLSEWAGLVAGSHKRSSNDGQAAYYSMAITSSVLTRDLLVFKKRNRHYLKLRDGDVPALLAAREPEITMTELGTVPGGQLVSAAEVISHESGTEIQWMPHTMDYPPLHIRRYEGRIGYLGNSLVHTATTVLPDSYRWRMALVRHNPRLTNLAGNHAAILPRELATHVLPGSYYQLDPQFAGHFGHVMTETISKLWGWDEAKRRDPDLKVLLRLPPGPEKESSARQMMYTLLGAYGIASEDIVWTSEAVWLVSLVCATAMWHNAPPHYVHPELQGTWARLTESLADPDARYHDRIFVSRGADLRHRNCRNGAQVEALFAAHGFKVIYPEQHDLRTQAGIFSKATVIAGFGGSAMFNLTYARSVKTMILLNHESYFARNEHLYTALLGGTVHYFWSPADVPLTADTTEQQLQSSWEFDFARNRGPLEDVLRSL